MIVRKKFYSLLSIVVCIFIINFSQQVHSATNTPIPSPFANICSNHGGVNCTILNPDASITCNDGTIDKSLSIYFLPQCQEAIRDTVKQQSEFMAKSGCMPPGEMACINEQSYQNLYKILTASKLATSELGKSELTQCRQDISDYQAKNQDYKQCLNENNNPQFDLPTNRLVQPILKIFFCSVFYGDNSSYDPDADLCLCDNGFFMSNGKCIQASLICQSKYGSRAYAKNGNCLVSQNTTAPRPTILATPITKNITVTPLQSPSTLPAPYYFMPTSTPELYEVLPVPEIVTKQTIQPPNFFKVILGAFVSGIKKLLRLF